MRRQLSYQFDLDIQRVHLLINMKCDVQVWWKSGKGKIATKNSIKLTGTQKFFDVKQKLSIIAKIIMQNGILREKKTQLLIILFTGQNTSKLGGRVNLNLAQFISSENLTMPIVKKFERSLQNCPDQLSKIVFNLSCKYIEQSFGNASENLHDISFQANNFTNSYSTSSNFAKSTADMTFRPEKQQFIIKKQLSNPPSSTTMQSNRSQYSSIDKKKNQIQRERQRQKLQTPSWEKSQRQRQSEYNVANNRREFQRPQQQQQIQPLPNQPRPLQFSFNPTQADRLKLGIDNSQIVKDLKQIVQQKTRTIKSLQQQLFKLRTQFDQKTQKTSSKSLALLNQLNSTSTQKQQLQRQRSQLIKEVEFLRQENKKLEQKNRLIHSQFQKFNQNAGKIQHLKKIIEQLNNKLQEADRKVTKYKDELFRKESQLISKQKQYATAQMNKQAINRQQTQKLKNISLSLKDLQNNFEKVFAQKEQLKRKYEESIQKLSKYQQSNMLTNQNFQKLDQELQKQREKSKLIQGKYKQRESLIHQIENQFKLFSNQKTNQLRQKDQQLAVLRDKFNAACKKIDQKSGGEQSMKNLVSQKNVRIKTLQGICAQLQKTLQEKEVLMAKAKQYVNVKQQEIQLKNTQIAKRDDFIQKCRTYMQTKQKQYNDAIAGSKINNNITQVMNIKKQLKQKQNMLQQYIYDRHQSQKQIQDMQRVIDRLKQRVMQCQDNMDQLQRKNESQEQTLKSLVKKNLDMQIQLNMKEYQIQSLRAIK